jgi:hypothetical protein
VTPISSEPYPSDVLSHAAAQFLSRTSIFSQVPSTLAFRPVQVVQSATATPLPFRDGFSSDFSAFSSLSSLLHRHHHPHTPSSGDHRAVQTFVCVLSLTIKSQLQSLQASAIPRSFQIIYSKFYHNVFHQIHYRCSGFTLPNCFFHRHI